MKSRNSENEDVKDEGPEEGEVLPDKGALSSLVEDEVGLWTTDGAAEQIYQSDEHNEKHGRRGDDPRRKASKKATYRQKRAEKERQLGVRHSKRIKLNEPPKKPCIFYIKGRCAKGKDCAFSHDSVPLTKSEPCKFLTMGCCLKGEDCPFSHELASFPCKYFHTRGFCYDAENCRFSHEAISDEEHKKLLRRMDQESRDRQDRGFDSQVARSGPSGPHLPPGYDLVHSPDKPTAPEERPVSLDQHSGLEGCPLSGKRSDTATQVSHREGPSCDELSHQPVNGAPETPVIVPGNSKCLSIRTPQERNVDQDGLVDQKEVKNYVLLAARKAAAAASAAAAGKSKNGDSSAKIGTSGGLSRGRSFEGSAMDLLKATLQDDGKDRGQVSDAVANARDPGRSKYVSAMALLEGMLKGEQ